jgi:hypothetical protein
MRIMALAPARLALAALPVMRERDHGRMSPSRRSAARSACRTCCRTRWQSSPRWRCRRGCGPNWARGP